jgi:dolichyl-phosphate beta-glucosyltransferase
MIAEARDLSLIVPAYNEAARLPSTLRTLQAFLATRPWRSEIVVVDDGSTDRTVEAARAAVTPAPPLRIVSLDVNRGKGAAVSRGVADARGRYIGFMDADLPYALEDIDLAMARLADGADVVIGGRDLPGSHARVDYSAVRALSTRLFAALVARLALRGIPDTQCGFKWFPAVVARQLFSRLTVTSFAFDVELLVLAQRWGLRVDRIPVSLAHSSESRVRLLRDPGRMLWDLVRINRQLARGAYDRR